MKKFFSFIFIAFGVLFLGMIIMSVFGVISMMNPEKDKLSSPAILHLELDGIITDATPVIEFITKHARKPEIKGVLMRINSPGGVVGPSQEIFSELKRVRDEYKKPVIVSSGSLVASGGYYAAVAADKIYVNPGTLMGSIGVIMEFPYLEKLYEWAKMDFSVIKTGAYKDAGSPMRKMTAEEEALFQDLIDEVHNQFKTAVMEGRRLSRDVVDKYADGRVFNGETAVKLGFADEIGTFEDAKRYIGEQTGLGADPKLYTPRKQPENLFEYLQQMEAKSDPIERITQKFKALELVGKPLYLMPQSLGL